MDPMQFDKQFKNMGIDREQVMRAGSSPNPTPQAPRQDDASDIGTLKRKLEYLTNSVLPKFQEAFTQMEEKIEQYRQEATSYKRDIVQLRSQVQELTRKTQSVRVVFGQEDQSEQSSTPVQSSAHPQSASQSAPQTPGQAPARGGTSTPDDVRIDKIFNFSGAKF